MSSSRTKRTKREIIGEIRDRAFAEITSRGYVSSGLGHWDNPTDLDIKKMNNFVDIGVRVEIPEPVMFYGFLLIFAAYYFMILRSWKVMRLVKAVKGG